jgi:DNA helicase II / ATP-dependent DNA helicase PcrA
VSHRSTLPIMRLADHVLGQARTSAGRPGKRPLWIHCRDQNDGTKQALRWLTRLMERHPETIAAVVCRDAAEARHVLSLLEPSFGAAVRLGDEESFLFTEGIVVTFPNAVKGLEFPNVLLWNPSAAKFPPNQASRQLLYLSITRAEENLALTTWGTSCKLLPDIYSKLIRGFDRASED